MFPSFFFFLFFLGVSGAVLFVAQLRVLSPTMPRLPFQLGENGSGQAIRPFKEEAAEEILQPPGDS